ncbi:type IV pilus twitching motility protein PilT [uncultured Desulfosarcina sp.]|uniref:type IV pilus twitching motility protein PilT n=1 Tax=uncultured Desulfosarcina sp. TaxID=218289 RepID=UPI0029C9AA88|nr:type IV pilus twitching motility protein PilT [uncultured Desulfosarcina sp.]
MSLCPPPPISEARPRDMSALFGETVRRGASDLHLTANMPPVFRLKGDLVPMACDPFSPEEIERLLGEILTPRHREVLREKKSVDFAISANDVGRFRIAAFYQRGALSVAARLLHAGIPTFASLGLPESIADLANLRDGLILVTGVTGSGKSTTLATVLDHINNHARRNIITIEDPIEYIHPNQRSVIHQRELHTDVPSFADALRDALRADPDVILVGEMRDLETMRTAIMAAETGHLVFSTLHSRDCVSTVNRLVGAFPAGEQTQIRQQLSSTLKAVVSQRLLLNAAGSGRVPAVEIMISTPGIANLIRQAKDDMIYSTIETGVQQGMQTMEQSLIRLIGDGKIGLETGLGAARSENLLRQRLSARRGGSQQVGGGNGNRKMEWRA